MRPLSVFVSSAMTELRNERSAIKRALTQIGYHAFVYEDDAHARPDTPQTTYLDELSDSDVYVGVFWNRYSGPTKEEYRVALELGKPCFIYVKEFDVHRDEQLNVLLEKVRQNHSIRKFSDIFELADFVQRDIHTWILEQWRKSKASPSADETRLQGLFAQQKEFESNYSKNKAILATPLAENEQDSEYDLILKTFAAMLDVRDKENDGHTKRVTAYTVKLARAYGVSPDELIHIQRGSILHDIGKLLIPENILLKPGALNDSEWTTMRQHPTIAQQILEPIKFLQPAISIPWCHHEKWDGSGFPRGLKGEEIPLPARIFAVADIYDALISTRPYRAAWPYDRVREYIQAQAGSHFDPKVVDVFLLQKPEVWEDKL